MLRIPNVLARASSRGLWTATAALLLFALAGCSAILAAFGLNSNDPAYEAALRFDDLLDIPTLSARRVNALAAPVSQLTAAGTVSLTSFTPTAPFRGNQVAIVGGALDTDNAQTGTLLVRQTDCSLTQYAIGPVNGTTSTITHVLPGADAYLHQLSGLTTTPGTFPRGCVDQSLGVPSTAGTYLGQASNGDLLSVLVNSSGKVSLLRFTTTGVPVSQTVLVASGAAFTLGAADLNGDGIADIVTPYTTVSGVSGIGVLLSHDDGSFDAPVVYTGYPAGINRFAAYASIDDINGDGKPDIVAIAGPGFDPGTVVSLLGRSDGTFALGSASLITLRPASFVLADFNGDGRKDMMSAGGYFSAGQGDGSFAAPVASGADAFAGQHLAVGDFNGDGQLDLALHQSTFIQIALGRGDGSFVPDATFATVRGAEYLSASDIDGDGNDDIVVGLTGPRAIGPNTDSYRVTQFLLGRGDGTFAAAQALPGAGIALFGGPTYAVADFNGDTYPDVVALAPNGASALVMFGGSSTGTLGGNGGAATTAATLSFRPFMVTQADVDGDGKADLVSLGAKLAVLRGQGDGVFGAEQAYDLPSIDGRISSLAVGDLNGDGRADVVVTFGNQSATTGGAFVYIANTDGTLRPAVQIDPAVNLTAAVADLDGDGRVDVVLVGGSSDFYSSPQIFHGLRIYRGQANGSFTAPQSLSPPSGTDYTSVAFGDMNEDGRLDVVAVGVDGGLDASLYILPGQGDGSFGSATSFAVPGGGPGIGQVAVGDYTGDGHPDLMLAGNNYSGIVVGNGDGTLRGLGSVAIASRATRVVAADLNSDGMMDAVMGIDFQGIVPLVRTASAIDTPPTTTPYTATLSASSGTVAGQGSVQVTLNFAYDSGFTDTVSLSCANLPAGASCSFSPASVTAADASSVLTISTGTSQAALAAGDSRPGGPATPSLAIAALMAVAAAAAFSRRPRWASRSGRWAIVAVAAAGLAAGCGGGHGDDTVSGATPAGTYTVNIITSSPSASQTLNYSLTVN